MFKVGDKVDVTSAVFSVPTCRVGVIKEVLPSGDYLVFLPSSSIVAKADGTIPLWGDGSFIEKVEN